MAFWHKKSKENRTIRVWATGTFLLMVAANALANALPINGQNTGQISDSYPNLFAPAGFTFAIWGVIYLALAGYTLYQLGYLQPKRTKISAETINAVSLYFAISSVLNTSWIFAWHYRLIWLTIPIMLGILYCLIKIANVLRAQTYTLGEQLLVRVPFGIYFGWITVATIADITTWLVSSGWSGWGQSQQFWVIAVLIAGAVIGLVRMAYDKDSAYGAVLVWAYIGILAKHLNETGWNAQYPAVIGSLVSLLVILVIWVGYIASRQYHLLPTQK